MFCNACGAPNPDGAGFCSKCGRPMGAATAGAPAAPAAAPAPPPPAAAPIDIKNLRCQGCGAPLNVQGGDAVVVCEYCGATVSLSGAGLKAIQNHSMLIPQVIDQQEAVMACKKWMDTGLFHRHVFEKATLLEAKAQMVPFWIIPASAMTQYTYQEAVQGAPMGGGGMVAGELVGMAIGGRNEPRMQPSPQTTWVRRQGELSGNFQFPIIAAKGLDIYQPREYQFDLATRVPFDKRKVPGNLPLLNGDLSEEMAKVMAKDRIVQLQDSKARAQHGQIQQINTQVTVSDGELLHAPVWYLRYELKDRKFETLTVDAARNAVMNLQKTE